MFFLGFCYVPVGRFLDWFNLPVMGVHGNGIFLLQIIAPDASF